MFSVADLAEFLILTNYISNYRLAFIKQSRGFVFKYPVAELSGACERRYATYAKLFDAAQLAKIDADSKSVLPHRDPIKEHARFQAHGAFKRLNQHLQNAQNFVYDNFDELYELATAEDDAIRALSGPLLRVVTLEESA